MTRTLLSLLLVLFLAGCNSSPENSPVYSNVELTADSLQVLDSFFWDASRWGWIGHENGELLEGPIYMQAFQANIPDHDFAFYILYQPKMDRIYFKSFGVGIDRKPLVSTFAAYGTPEESMRRVVNLVRSKRYDCGAVSHGGLVWTKINKRTKESLVSGTTSVSTYTVPGHGDEPSMVIGSVKQTMTTDEKNPRRVKVEFLFYEKLVYVFIDDPGHVLKPGYQEEAVRGPMYGPVERTFDHGLQMMETLCAYLATTPVQQQGKGQVSYSKAISDVELNGDYLRAMSYFSNRGRLYRLPKKLLLSG